VTTPPATEGRGPLSWHRPSAAFLRTVAADPYALDLVHVGRDEWLQLMCWVEGIATWHRRLSLTDQTGASPKQATIDTLFDRLCQVDARLDWWAGHGADERLALKLDVDRRVLLRLIGRHHWRWWVCADAVKPFLLEGKAPPSPPPDAPAWVRRLYALLMALHSAHKTTTRGEAVAFGKFLSSEIRTTLEAFFEHQDMSKDTNALPTALHRTGHHGMPPPPVSGQARRAGGKKQPSSLRPHPSAARDAEGVVPFSESFLRWTDRATSGESAQEGGQVLHVLRQTDPKKAAFYEACLRAQRRLPPGAQRGIPKELLKALAKEHGVSVNAAYAWRKTIEGDLRRADLLSPPPNKKRQNLDRY